MTPRDPVAAASAIQRRAADPGTSVALRASAGSGKTRVLIDRFVRLCVETDAHPRAILAITFTRRAATEIRARLLDRARGLALADPAERRERLAALLADRPRPGPTAEEEDRAARLYERLLEDPAGLQVGTIHAFCQRVLARFATEAGLDPHAALLEHRDDLEDEARDLLLAEAAADGSVRRLAEDLGHGPGAVRRAVKEVFDEQMRVDRWLRRLAREAGRDPLPRLPRLPDALAELRRFLWPDLDAGDDPRPDDVAPGLARDAAAFAGPGLDAVAAALDADETAKAGKYLARLRDDVRAAADDPAALRAVLLRQDGQVRAFCRAGGAALKARVQALVLEAAGPLLAGLRRLDLLDLYRRNRAVLTVGLRALDLLDTLKRRDRVLDFGDLEDMACRLLGDEARALSLLYRLDDAIAHILVDEFQDTNFNQRDILAPFVAEFLAGGTGTVFFVGDLKQSIYGFRGAEPGIFADMMAVFAARDLPVPTLPTNFRSLPAVVDGVGGLFTAPPLAGTLPAGETEHVHQAAARDEDDGLLLVLEAYEDADDGRTADQVAADAAARICRGLVDGGAVTWEGWGPDAPNPRLLAWSDILVLYRTRTGVSLYEQAFRAAGIPFEPAGRGMLAATREVQDVLALLRWLVWPDDDVALATVLRAPLFRLPEDLFQRLLAARGLDRRGPEGRPQPPDGLWTALRARRADDPRLEEAAARLEAWRADTGFVGCHELLRRVYREGHVLERYAVHAGGQARINLERLHDLALAPDVAGTPTVRRFVEMVDKAGRRGGQDEGAAGPDGGAGRVRFMTVHGAKGLEAPVVLLVDADRVPQGRGRQVRVAPRDGATALVFGASRDDRRGYVGAGDAAGDDPLRTAAAEADDAAATEETNLLYVAMTRARDRLVVLGGRTRTRDDDDGAPATPLRRLRAGAAAAAGAPVRTGDPDGLERPPAAPAAAPDRGPDGAAEVRAWSPPALAERPAAATPSAAAEEQEGAAPSPVAAAAAAHGLQVHRLLQLATEQGAVPPGDGPAHDEARAVFEDPRLGWIFRPGADGGRGWSEAPLIHGRPGGARTTGVVDRLVVRPGRVDVVDYKTNRGAADPARRAALADHYAPQLAAYRDAAVALFPGRTVRAWLLLTDPDARGGEDAGLLEVPCADS